MNRKSLLLLLSLLGPAFITQAENPAAPAEMAEALIELPRLVVKDTMILPKPEQWKYASMPGYEVLTSASAKNTQYFVREFSRLQQVLDAVWPSLKQKMPAVPVSIVLCDKSDQFEAFFPPEKKPFARSLNCLFYQDKESATIIVNFGATELYTGLLDSAVTEAGVGINELGQGMADAGNSGLVDETNPASMLSGLQPGDSIEVTNALMTQADPFKSFRYSYLEFLISSGSHGKLPEWFMEGLLQIFMQVDYTKKTVEVGRVGSVDGVSNDDFNFALRNVGLLPMSELLGPKPKSHPTDQYIWTKQCEAFVHYSLFGERRSNAPALLRLLTRLEKEPLNENLFKECYGFDYKTAQVRLRGYLSNTQHTYSEFVAHGKTVYKDPPALQVVEATDGQVGRIKGEALRLSGQPEEAAKFVIAPYIRGERDPDLLSVLGMAEMQSHRNERAFKFLKAAVQGKTTRARAYVNLAELQANMALAEHPSAKLNRAEMNTILPLLSKARAFPPLLPEIYEVTADCWQASEVKPDQEEFNFLLQGALLFPARLQLVYRVALIAAKAGFTKEALLLVEHGERYSPNDRGRALFSKLRSDYSLIEQGVPVVAPQKVPAQS